ncbi:hypothetical protein [Domibacillus indicus]|uniref:hypothetical protein n=1 Tax=Domibacillus indicus TaxID=1437523 RepID=UPI0006182837|nr:hypothetical protein [Domibacillus indicus]
MLKKLFESKVKEQIFDSVRERKNSGSESEQLNRSNKEYYSVSSEIIYRLVELTKSVLNNSVLHTEDIPEKKVSNVVSTYGIEQTEIVALYDTTLFKSGKDGIVLCEYCICYKHAFGSALKVNFKDLVKSGINSNNQQLYVEGNIYDLKTEEFTLFFKLLKDLLLEEDQYLNSIYTDYVINTLNTLKDKIEQKLYTEAEEKYISLENIIVNKDKNYRATLNFYGFLIKIEQANFEEAYKNLSNLKELGEWEESRLGKLKEIFDSKKARHEFIQLKEQKEICIKENQFDQAIILVVEQKKLGVKSIEQLDEEIKNIEFLKGEYICSLESAILEKIKTEEYSKVLLIIEELNNINPTKQYEEYYIQAKIGLYAFEEVEAKIAAIEKTDKKLAAKLEQSLQKTKMNISNIIHETVRNKNYTFFQNYPDLKGVKDNWGMTPLMHFIVQRDVKGVQLLADTYNSNDRNILGHSTLNLVSMDAEDDFIISALEILDYDLIQMLRELKNKGLKNKVGNFLIKGVDSINSNVGNLTVMSATSEMEVSINNSLEEYQRKVEIYVQELLTKNQNEYMKYLLHPKTSKEEYEKLLLQKQKLESELEIYVKSKLKVENSFEGKFEALKNSKLDSILYEAASIEMGEKDEFETSSEFEIRKRTRAEELKSAYNDNPYIRKQLNILEQEIKVTITKDLSNLTTAIESREKMLNSIKRETENIQHHLNNQFDASEVVNYYYQSYISEIEIGLYDADTETFKMLVGNQEKNIKVSRPIAKEFKMQFADLRPVHKMQITNQNDKKEMKHYFSYEFKGEHIMIPFLVSFYQNSLD